MGTPLRVGRRIAGADWGCDYDEIHAWEIFVFTDNKKWALLRGFHSLC